MIRHLLPPRRARIAWSALAALALSGCGNPCEDFADLACRTAGSASEECQRARRYAENAPSAEQALCSQALELAKTLKRN